MASVFQPMFACISRIYYLSPNWSDIQFCIGGRREASYISAQNNSVTMDKKITTVETSHPN